MSTVLYGDSAPASVRARPEGDDLWVPPSVLPAAIGWELKPEGVCRGDLCVPIPDDGAEAMLRDFEGEREFNLAEFARFIGQPYARDEAQDAWYFGANPLDARSPLESLEAPDFELPDLEGRTYRLSDYRGQKIFLLLWASW